MTNEEAKKLIEGELYCRNTEWIVCLSEGRECSKCKGNISGSLVEAYEVAVAALEKQIPKKPIKDRGKWKCPICEQGVSFKLIDYRVYILSCECGQRLDWSDEF